MKQNEELLTSQTKRRSISLSQIHSFSDLKVEEENQSCNSTRKQLSKAQVKLNNQNNENKVNIENNKNIEHKEHHAVFRQDHGNDSKGAISSNKDSSSDFVEDLAKFSQKPNSLNQASLKTNKTDEQNFFRSVKDIETDVIYSCSSDLKQSILFGKEDSSGSLQALFKAMPLEYALSLLTQMLSIPIHVFDENDNYIESSEARGLDNWNVLFTDVDYRKQLLNQIRTEQLLLFTHERPVLLGGVKVLDGLCLILGPIAMLPVDKNFEKIYAIRHNAVNTVLPYFKPARLAAMLLLIHASLTGEKVSLGKFLERYFIQEDRAKQADESCADIYYNDLLQEKPHNPVSFEKDIISAVKAGDINALDRALNSPYASMRGVLAKDELRSKKNLAIVDMTIVSRAMIDVGFPSEECFIIGDAFIRNLEEVKDAEEATALARLFAQHMTSLMRKFLDSTPNIDGQYPIAQLACEYMDRNVFDKLDIDAIAKHVNASRSHLFRVFKEAKNMTLREYFIRKKLEIASVMLTNSRRKIGDIAFALSFCNESHFVREFRRFKGCTPSAFRRNAKLHSNIDIKK